MFTHLARILTKVAEAGGALSETELTASDFHHTHRVVTIHATSEDHAASILKVLESLPDLKVLSWQDDTFQDHVGGKLTVPICLHRYLCTTLF